MGVWEDLGNRTQAELVEIRRAGARGGAPCKFAMSDGQVRRLVLDVLAGLRDAPGHLLRLRVIDAMLDDGQISADQHRWLCDVSSDRR